MSVLPETDYEVGESKRRFYGKYRGRVSNNKDPEKLGRIRARVRDTHGEWECGWALPSLPYAGKNVGMLFLPPENTWVWIEFERGDPDDPVWTGCFWAEGEAPAQPTTPERKVLKTDTATLTLDEPQTGMPSFSFETSAGLRIVVDTNSVEITNGKGATIKLSGPTVSLNGNALEVT